MPWFKKHDAIFVHIPKTGGTTVLRMFGLGHEPEDFDIFYHMTDDFEYDHASAQYLKSQIPDTYERCFKFTLVRNPYDRMVSEYFWKLKDNDVRGVDVTGLTFEKFIEQLYANFQKILCGTQKEKSHFVPQCSFLLEDVEVFKFEQIDLCLNYLTAKFGVPKPEGRFNVTDHEPYETYYTEKCKKMVYDLYYMDFLTLGYRK